MTGKTFEPRGAEDCSEEAKASTPITCGQLTHSAGTKAASYSKCRYQVLLGHVGLEMHKRRGRKGLRSDCTRSLEEFEVVITVITCLNPFRVISSELTPFGENEKQPGSAGTERLLASSTPHCRNQLTQVSLVGNNPSGQYESWCSYGGTTSWLQPQPEV